MFVEIHLLQNFAPSNLNRDDTGAPKDCEFGGHRRARISSQCLKRAIRKQFERDELLVSANLAIRTKRVVDAIADRLRDRSKDLDQARGVAAALVGLIKSNLHNPKEGKTQYLLFLGARELDRAADLCIEHWDKLKAAAAAAEAEAAQQASGKRVGKKDEGASLPKSVRTELERLLDGGRAADLALFGRMLADLPERNIDAASQVAHALSTNRVSMEMDFYTAVDDLKPDDTAGADMLGTIEFNSACFYRYANVDLEQLKRNLLGKETKKATLQEETEAEGLARATLKAFLRASIAAIPTGKQNSMAAQNPPSLVFAVARHHGLWNLANAFVRPIWPGPDGDLVERSATALGGYWQQLAQMYGRDSLVGAWACALNRSGLAVLEAAGVEAVGTVNELFTEVLAVASFERRNGVS